MTRFNNAFVHICIEDTQKSPQYCDGRPRDMYCLSLPFAMRNWERYNWCLGCLAKIPPLLLLANTEL